MAKSIKSKRKPIIIDLTAKPSKALALTEHDEKIVSFTLPHPNPLPKGEGVGGNVTLFKNSKLQAAIRTLLTSGALLGCINPALANPAMVLPKPEAVLTTMGVASYSQDGVHGVITQQTEKAILNWKSFDIGPQNSVEFKQPSATSIALNRINERANPSQILGELKANGQVYLYNPNGFVFGQNARVNTNSLVVSTLDVSDEAFERGVTKVFDQTKGQAAFQWTGKVYDVDHPGSDGKPTQVQVRANPNGTGVNIQSGAQINTNAANGRILIVAPTVENHGSVTANDGEVIMAAAKDKLYLQESPATATVSGLLVEVGQGGAVTNGGNITARRGNITLAGFAVNQEGMITATTSVRQNGTIRLLAREGGRVTQNTDTVDLKPGSTYRPTDAGDGLGQSARVHLGSGSITQVQPDLDDPTTAVDEQAQPKSQIEIYGKQIRLDGGSQVLAPAGNVNVKGEGLINGTVDSTPRDTRIDMAAGSRIDVSGLNNVSKAMESNLLNVELRLNELRDSPLQRYGQLRNQTVQVDVRRGTPIADITSAAQRIGRTIAERSTTGGSVTLDARGAIVINSGATINIAGGSVQYQGGYLKTTQLISDHRIVDISQASPDMIYEGIFSGIVSKTYSKWNKTLTWNMNMPSRSTYEPGYVEGKDAGSLTVITEALKLDGMVNALTQRGVKQRTAETQPQGGSLSIDLSANQTSGFVGQGVVLTANASSSGNLKPDASFPGLEEKGKNPSDLVISGDFQKKSGVSHAEIKTTGTVSIAQGTTVSVPDAGSLKLTGGQISQQGKIDAPGGQVVLATEVSNGAKSTLDGSIKLASGSGIDVSGNWVNDYQTPELGADYSQLSVMDAGSIKLSSQGDIQLAKGSELAADGGAWLQQNGAIQYGKGGDISIESTAFPDSNASNLDLAGSLHAYGAQQGGSLSLTTNEILVSNAQSKNQERKLHPLVLDSGFFSLGGFSNFKLTSNLSGIAFGSDAHLDLKQENWVFAGQFTRAPSSRSVAAITRREVLPNELRQATNLTLALHPPLGQLRTNSGISLAAGSSIVADPKAEINLLSEGSIDVAGSITAPAGSINLKILAPTDSEKGTGFMASQGIFVESTGRLDARGTTVYQTDAFGKLTGQVLAGGEINLLGERGYLFTASGSSLDASGVSGWLNLPNNLSRGVAEKTGTAPTADSSIPAIRVAPLAQSQQLSRVDSNGGSISLMAAEGILQDGTLTARAGGPKATGGHLSVELNKLLRNAPTEAPFPSGDRIVEWQAANTQSIPSDWVAGKDIPLSLNGLAQLSTESVMAGGFGSLSVKSNDQIRFAGDLNLSLQNAITLDAPVLSWRGETGTVNLSANYVAAGFSFNRHATRTASAGSGHLSLSGELIDLFGSTSLQGFADASLNSSGDLRLRGVAPNLTDEVSYSGEWKSTGNLTLKAQRIYPSTATTFAINLTGSDSRLELQQAAGSANTPLLSAGGKLSLSAADIVQGGNLQAPFGSLSFSARRSIHLTEGSLTSVSGAGLTVPFGRTPGGLDWLYPLVAINTSGNVVSGEINIVYQGPPEKSVSLSAPDVSLEKGAKLNIAGGGDLTAFEFVPGLGGSIDILNPRDPNVLNGKYNWQETYAVIPAFKNNYAPYDPIETSSYIGTENGLKVGDSVYLAGGGGLAAGEYALLPAHYALLPGAYLVTVKNDVGSLLPGQTLTDNFGASYQAGYRKTAGSSEQPAVWQTYTVQPGSVANLYSEFQFKTASTFFDQKAASEGTTALSSVNDAGRLTLAATQTLRLAASIDAKAANGGRGGQLDVVADKLAIVGQASGLRTDGSIELVAGELNQLGMESLVLGASRSKNTSGTNLTISASQVQVESGAHLQAPEILLVAKQQVSVQSDAEVAGVGSQNLKPVSYNLTGDAALLRVSSGPQAGYSHTAQTGKQGDLILGAGSLLSAQGSMLLDSSRNTTLEGSLTMHGGDLSIIAGLINLGETPAGASGAVLSSALLSGLQVDSLKLQGRDGINLYGNVDLNLTQLYLDAPRFSGFNNPNAKVQANAIELSNHSGKTPTTATTGSGQLALLADTLTFADGSYAISGFDQVLLQGNRGIRFTGTGALTVAANTQFNTAKLTGGNGASFNLDASGYALAFNPIAASPAYSAGLGTQLHGKANQINLATDFELPSGLAEFTALTGDLNVLPSARLNLAGIELNYGPAHYATPGGLLSLTAKQGNIALQAGSSILLQGGAGAAAGTLQLTAPKGTASFEGTLLAGQGGVLSVDAIGFGAGGFSGLNLIAGQGGFDGSLTVRQRSGDLNVALGEIVKAGLINLSADAGKLTVGGLLDARGGNGGEIVLSSTGQLTLSNGATLLANGLTGVGGKVELASGVSVSADPTALGLQLLTGSLIDVAGPNGGGDVHLRALRNNSGVSIAPIQSTINGADRVIAEAVEVVNTTNFNNMLQWKNSAANFMAQADAISAQLGAGAVLMPGLEIRSTGDLTLNQAFDLYDWRYNVNGESVPGFLTVRAGGNITLNQSISDGFDPGNTLQSGESWGLRVVSGADFGSNTQTPVWSSDWRATQKGLGNLTLNSGALLRTGTGAIDIQAGGNITLKNQTAAIYTAGRKDLANPYGNLNENFLASYFIGYEYPIDGGDIRISAAGNIIGAASDQFIPDWLMRMGSFQSVSAAQREQGDVFFDGTISEFELPTSWAINYNFQQNLGALGGGDVVVNAGGNIRNLQIMLPTTGKQVGRINESLPLSEFTYLGRYITNEVEVNGGGNLSVTALGNIEGGQYFVDQGTAKLNAYGSIQGGSSSDVQFSSGPLFAIGNADFQVSAGHDIQLGAAYNPSALKQRQGSLVYFTRTTFMGYGENSALRMESRAGNVEFRNDIDLIAAKYQESGSSVLQTREDLAALRILPGTVEAVALQGGIQLSSFNLFPSATGNLSLIAKGDIQSDAAPAEVVVNLSDADPTLFPSAVYPKENLLGILTLLDTSEPDPIRLPKSPLHANDTSMAQIISQSGSINGNNNLKIFLAKPAYISAGVDILDIGLSLQNMRSNDVSVLSAGRDLRYHINRGSVGELEELQGFGIDVAGPGQLHVLAGRNIDLGASDGITTSGNLINTSLADQGASVSLLAGLNSKPTYLTLLESYFGTSGDYGLDASGRVVYGGSPDASAIARIRLMTEDQQRELALTVLFNELKLSSEEAATGGSYARGEKAIASLFPSSDYSGDIKLFFSRIHTLDGGNIDLLAPGGLINAGLASAFVGEKKPSELGVVTQRGGAVLTYTRGDFQVNQSRVFAIASLPTDFTPRFTLFDTQGQQIEPYKDIVAWSSEGSIDAGRGSKGALSVSGGKKGFDQLGNLTEDVPPSIDGSGIRAQIRGTIDPGSVYLAAPKGIVDAGEAGIGGSQVTIAATAIVGASNIQTGAGGLSSNVATTPAPSVVAPASASSAAASASQMAQQNAAGNAADKASSGNMGESLQKTKVTLLMAELIGAGDYSLNDIREGKHVSAAPTVNSTQEAAQQAEEEAKKKKP